MTARILRSLAVCFVVSYAAVFPVDASEVAKADLSIVGVSLEVDRTPVATGIDIPAVVQTIFGGKTNDAAPPAAGMTALGDLSGPGIDTPITISAVPGRQFTLPPLHQAGEYSLQNIRLVGSDGKFVQSAVPSFATITVSDILKTSVSVRQLSADELRQRGITVDGRNYEVYEYTFVFGLKDQLVQVPYIVAVDSRTHEFINIPQQEGSLPTPKQPGPPPRFDPPAVYTGGLEQPPDGPGSVPAPDPFYGEGDTSRRKPIIPVAIVIPTNFGVLHQFFAVIINVTNNAPAGSDIKLDSINATLDSPLTMRVANSNPSVAIGQAVPIYEKTTGAKFLIAQAEGSADWSLEALKAGTHTVNIAVRATYKAPNQADVPLAGNVSASISVSDPRFQVNFVHPDVVRAGENYTAYAFITNTSPQAQNVKVDTSDIPTCGSGYSGNNVCRTSGDAVTNLSLAPGEMKAVPYPLQSKVTGAIYAAAATADSGIAASVALTMGVSTSGIRLSPATLVLPHYAQYVNQGFVNAQLGLLGLGYSLASAPLTQTTAAFPRVLRNDVFQRAQDIARAGQRIFVMRRDAKTDDPAEDREAVFNLSLDLLSNIERRDKLADSADLKEWDQLRRMESDGRTAGAAMARELERVGLAGGKSATQFVDDFAAATSHRSPYFLALVHGTAVTGNDRPYALSVTGVNSKAKLDLPSEATTSWVRALPFAELTHFNAAGEYGELALVGRWKEALDLSVNAAGSQFTVELIYPDVTSGAFLRTTFQVTGATAGTPVDVVIDGHGRTLIVNGATAVPIVNEVPQTPLRVTAAAQDLFIDNAGHLVSLLFNRPIVPGDPLQLRNLFSLTTTVSAASYQATRRNNANDPNAPVVIPGAALQSDNRLLNVTFDKSLSSNAVYTLAIDPVTDALVPSMTFTSTSIVPRIDNNGPAGIVYGKVLRGDNTIIPKVTVQLTTDPLTEGGRPATGAAQFDTTLDNGQYLFEFVPRDPDRGLSGAYKMRVDADGKSTEVSGSVRLTGEAQHVDIVFLGRGSVQGRVSYSDGTPAANAAVTIGNTRYNTFVQEFKSGTADAAGNYSISDVPVGPLTIAATDSSGNVVYAANQIRMPGEVLTQDLVFQKRELAGFAAVRVTVKRSDLLSGSDPTKALVAGAHVGVYTQGYGLLDGFTDANGQYVFPKVPAGFVSILASEFSITRESVGIDLDLRADTTIDQVLTLHVPTAQEAAAAVTVTGTVWRDDPAAPSDTTRDQRVAGAIVTIRGFASVTADVQGNYVYDGIPLSLTGQRVVDVYDPSTGRRGTFSLPTLQAGGNPLTMRLQTLVPQGTATLRVRLLSATGDPVVGYRVLWPGFPPDVFADKGNGIYEMANIRIPATMDVWAVPNGRDAKYGDQLAHGSLRADFDGQIAVLELRLPGQGTILGHIQVAKSCDKPPCGWDPAFGPLAVTYRVWDDAEQSTKTQERVVQADPTTNVTTITQVPAGMQVGIATVDHPAGFASTTLTLGYEGETRDVTLQLSSLGDVTGRVLSYDGQTPVAGASVRLVNSVAQYAPVTTGSDGGFKFAGVPANTAFTLVADVTQDGIYRTGFVEARTPLGGGPVGPLALILRQQARIEGNVVDANGTAIPLALYWVRELSWPYRSFGSAQDPLSADKNGHFVLTNLFAGGFRVSAKSPVNQDLRGDAQGEIKFESDDQKNVTVTIGGAGTGAVSVTVVDSNNSFQRVANAEVTLYRGGAAFDIATTDANGSAYFDQVPVDTYTAAANAKAIARTGSAVNPFTVAKDATSPVQITLDILGKVSGTLTDPELTPAAPVVGAPVTLYAGVAETHASTGGAGEFQFIGVPEGKFRLMAVDVDSGRRAFSDPNDQSLFISKLFQERASISLTLEKLASLNVKAYLPNDNGDAGVLAPLVNVKVTQSRGYSRELQGNDLTFPKMFLSSSYDVTATELGGDNRVVSTQGSFAPNTNTGSISLVFPTSGTVQVQVTADDPTLVPGARVEIRGGNKIATVYTDASGLVSVDGFALGAVSAQVTSANLSAAGSGTLASHSTPLVLNVKLGSRASIAGFVEAEEGIGQPSAGTRVLVDVSSSSGSLHLETRTDSTGHYQFNGIPVSSTTVAISAIGPDDVTRGAYRPGIAIPAGSTGIVQMPSLKLDATPPRVVSIDPANNSNSVSPNAPIVITFSEPISNAFLTSSYFRLLATDDSTYPALTIAYDPNNALIVRLTPAVLLKSNVVYALTISDAITDLTGNKMHAPVGSSFTTVNYTEPKIVRVDPAAELPIPAQTTFRLKFNKAIDITSFQPANGGVIHLEQLDAYKGQHVADLAVSVYLDTVDPSTVVVAPTGVAIQQSSYYRLTVTGARDTQTPSNVQKAPQIFDFFSFDLVKPVVSIKSPVPDAYPLITGVAYTATPLITDEGTSNPSKDTAYVDWFDSDGTTDTFRARVKTAPFGYFFVAPNASSFTLKASATDLSGNTSALAAMTWTVKPNAAPTDVVVTNTPTAVYLAGKVATEVAFKDEGLSATVALAVSGKHQDGTAYPLAVASIHPAANQQITRTAVDATWPAAKYTVDVPADVKEGEPLQVTATVTDSIGQATTQSANVDVLADLNKPVITSLLPAAETHFKYGNTYTMTLTGTDAESGINHATFAFDNQNIDLKFGVPGTSFDPATGTYTFRTASINVPAKNNDTRIHIVATAYDYHGNSAAQTVDVVYEGVNDVTIPKGSWLTPVDGAALPSDQSATTVTLRVRATDDYPDTLHVSFASPQLANSPVAASRKSGTTDVFEAIASMTTPAAGTSFTLTATVSDDNPLHDVVLPITIDAIAIDQTIPDAMSITASTAAQYAGKSLAVRGASAKLYVTTPLSLKNLLVLDGGTVGNPDRVKLDLTVADRLYVDGLSSIDVSGKGYLGAWQTSEDGATHNQSSTGMTVGGTTTGGPTSSGSNGASGSYAGIGGADIGTTTNTTYGSITDPSDFGTGGAGSSQCCTKGGNGGGAIAIHGGSGSNDLSRIAIAGVIRADGGTGVGQFSAGSGGSIAIAARNLITGPATRISANGGDEDGGGNTSRGGGGGRVSLRVDERLDVDGTVPVIQSHGGRNGTTNEGAAYLDAGAGTTYLRRPGESNGELIITEYDERYPSSTHLTRGTPLAGALTFDAITIGPRALARFDSASTGPMTVDSTALVLTPADQPAVTNVTLVPVAGSTLPQASKLAVTYSANAVDGIGSVTLKFAGAAPDTIDPSSSYPSSIASKTTTLTVANDSAAGSANLVLRAESRSGRTFDTAPSAFTIAANTPPTIDQFDVDPPNLAMYAGHTITVNAAATDDMSVTDLSLTTSVGTLTSGSFTAGPHVTRQFTVVIPPQTPNGTTVQLTLSAADGFANRVAITQQKSVTILTDSVKPTLTLTQPPPDFAVNDGVSPTLLIDATVSDAEVGVQTATATFDGVPYELAQVTGTNRYTKTVPVPHVYGTERVAKTLTVTAKDYAGNSSTVGPQTVYIIPAIDPNGPTMSWTCSSPGAMYPAGLNVTISVYALAKSGADAQVQFQIDGGPWINGTANPSLAHTWDTTLQLGAAEAAGTQHAIVTIGTAPGGYASSLSTTITVIAGTKIDHSVDVTATDTTYDNASLYIVSGGSLNVTGAHRFANVAVLGGGVLVQKQANLQKGEAITVNALYVACSGTIHANALGFLRNTAYPGAGTPGDSAGGGHMGRGGINGPAPGGTFGSIYRPLEAGGGGQIGDPNYDGALGGAGGGVIRLSGGNITVDGVVRANAREASTWGSGAGGSVYITATKLTGNGSLQANGATWSGGTPNNRGGGGGGAVAVEYDSVSGTILNNLTAMGGVANSPGAAGTSYVKSTDATYGDLTISNGNRSSSLPAQVVTELPAFGMATVLSVPSVGAAVVDALWEGPYLAGNYLRVVAPDGGIRGTWRIASITNDPSVRALNGVLAVPVQAIAYDGYLMYSDSGYGPSTAHVLPVRNNSGTWQYDDGSTFNTFTPKSGDVLFASFSKAAANITSLQVFSCSGACSPVAGLPTVALVRGEVLMNATRQNGSLDQPWSAYNVFLLDRDYESHGLVLSGGPATVTLESGADVRAGDTVRGVYLVDHLTIRNARVYTSDLVVSTTTPSVDASTTYVTGNAAAPVVNPSRVSFVNGANGPLVVGQANAALDSDGPIEITVRNAAHQLQTPAFTSNGLATVGTRGGLSMRKVPNGNGSSMGLIQTQALATGYAYVQGRPSRTDKHSDIAIGEFDFGFLADSTVGVWINGWRTNRVRYSAQQLFRIEKTPTTVTFLIDGSVVYSTTCNSAPRAFVVGSWDDDGEINSIECGYDTPARFTGLAAADGSFTIPIYGTAGDPLSISGRDRHVYPLTSADQSLGAIPSTIGISRITFDVTQGTGGHPVIATVTLGSATSTAATIPLGSSSTAASVPTSVTIPAGSASATFTISTQAVTAPASVMISALYGGVATNAALTIVPDAIPPTVSVTSPAANSHYTEGAANAIQVRATVTDSDSGVAQVYATFDGTDYPMTAGSAGAYAVNLSAPFVDGTVSVTKTVIITAVDKTNNVAKSDPVSVIIDPVTDAGVPTIAWTCGPTVGTYPVGYDARLRVVAKAPNATNVIQKVEVTVTDAGGTATVYAASPVSGLADNYEILYRIPNVAEGATFSATSTVTTVSGTHATTTPATIVAAANVTAITANTTISDTDTSYEGKSIAVYSTTTSTVELTIAGPHSFSRLMVLSNGRVSHAQGVATFDVTTTGTTYVACDGFIDATGRGYSGNIGYPGERAASRGSGGSHIGYGSLDDGASPRGNFGTVYGSVKRPSELGGGGGYWDSMIGGGRIRLKARDLVVDGAIRANGQDANKGAAAGGSIWITANRVAGNGLIEARGSNPSYTSAGGGAIALEYSDPSSGGAVLATLSAKGAVTGIRYSGAGSIFIKGPNSTNGSLTIDNGALGSNGTSELPSLGARTVAQLTSSGGVRLAGEHWVAPYFVGHEAEVTSANGTSKGIVRITAIDNGWYRFIDASEWYLADGATESGYLLYSEATTGARGITSSEPAANHWLPVAYMGGQWRYEDNGGFNSAFTPQPTDRIFASFTMTGTTWSFTPITCPSGVCGTINGIQTAEGMRGTYEPNAVVDGGNDGELAIRGVLIKDAVAPEVKFESVTGTPITFEVGDSIKPLYQFDSVSMPHGEAVVSFDEIRVNGVTQLIGPTAPGLFVEYTAPISASQIVLTGNISATSISANSLIIATGAVLSHPYWSANPDKAGLTLNVSGSITVTGTIDVSGRGYTGNRGYLGERVATRGSGGSHIGRGGLDDGANPRGSWGTVFGSVKRPSELGGGGGYWGAMTGGGRLRIITNSLQIDGVIRANGQDANQGGAGGGSIWITSDKINGNGIIDARGSTPAYTAGGGGAIALEYSNPASAGAVLSSLSARGASNGTRVSGAGSIFVKGPTSTDGSLTIDDSTSTNTGTSELPWLARRTVTAVTAIGGVRLTGEHWVAPYYVGNEVEVTSATGTSKGIARITAIDNGWYRTIEPSEWYLSDGATESGYLVYSEGTTGARGIGNGPSGNHWFPVAYVNGQWRYEDNGGFNSIFTPQPTDRIFAWFTMTGYSWTFTPMACPGGVCGTINGIQTAEALRGVYEPNATVDNSNAGELDIHSILIKDGLAPELKLESISGTPITLEVGDAVRGIYRFDSIKLRNSKLLSADKVITTTTDYDAASSVAVNDGPPLFSDTSQIHVSGTSSGPTVVGPAAAVTDPDTPVKLTATNVRTGVTYTANAAADGSFSISVGGNAGDTFTLVATDSHAVPLSTDTVTVSGAISAATPGLVAQDTRPSAAPVSGAPAATTAPRPVSGEGRADVQLGAQAPAAGPVFSVNRALISISSVGEVVFVRGSRDAVTGPDPLSVALHNETLGVSLPIGRVGADGSFEVSLAGAPGDHFTLEATCGTGEHTAIDLGVVPDASRPVTGNDDARTGSPAVARVRAAADATGDCASAEAPNGVPLAPLALVALLEPRANDVRADGNRPSATAPTPILRQ
jgi:hypothetical protein